MIVRPATEGDLPRAAALFDQYRQFYGAPPDHAAALAFLSQRLARDESAVLLAFSSAADSRAIGLAQLYRSFSSLELAPIVILNDLFVDPAARRLGVARALVASAGAYAVRLGAVRLELATQHTNQAARRLYRSLGWVEDREFVHLSFTPERSSSSAREADTEPVQQP